MRLFNLLKIMPWVTGWKIQFWKWDIPQKVKLFFWLAFNNKISTWDNLLHRGWSGPGRCTLCKQESEDNTHLFIKCSFTRAVWDIICRHSKITHCLNGENLCDCMTKWIEAKTGFPRLVAVACWNIWIARNEAIFEGKEASITTVAIKTLSISHKQVIKHKKVRSITYMNPVNIDYPVAFFDGAAQRDGKNCGAGGIIKISKTILYKWHVNCGWGSNTKAELMGAWATIHLAKYFELEKLHVFGDSLVIINWLSEKGKLEVCSLTGWKRRINILKKRFTEINFYHILREFNRGADEQSKKALLEQEGHLVIQKWMDGRESSTNIIHIY
jgi:ribonuclease HI